MAQAGIGWAQPDIEQQQIERSRALAQQLRQQGQIAPQGQTVSGHYIAPNWTEQLAAALSPWAADQADKRTDDRAQAYAEKLRTQGMQDVQDFTGAMQGTPGRTIQPLTPNDDEGNAMPAVDVAAVGPDRAKALGIAMSSKNPMLQQAGGSILSSMMPKAPEWAEFKKPDGQGGSIYGFVDKNAANPLSTFQAGGTMPAKSEFVNGAAVNPYSAAPGTVIPKQPDAPNLGRDLVIPGPNGAWTPNAPVIDARKQIAKSGAASTNVSVNTATKPFLQEIGKGVGEAVNTAFAGAQSAQGTLNNVAQIRQGLGNAIMGPGANTRIKISQIGEVLGVNGKDSTEQLQNTRSVLQGLARQELSAAGQMKGQGQITESERGILRRAEAGDITELTKPEVETLLNALEKTSRYRIQNHNRNLDRLSQDPNAAGVVDYMRVDAPAPAGAAPAAPGGGFKIIGVN